ncbi:MAG: glutaredoxin family protein [Desulfobacteraceae bacterium]|nr:glutaredoxin family protein [Desulfobacteraceae bacterium]
MKKIFIAVSIVFVIGLVFSNGIAQIYQWTDEDGVKHFSNTPPATKETVMVTKEVPPTYDKPAVVQSRTTKSPGIVITKKQAYKKSYQKNEVELFSTSWCKYCTMAREFLTANNIPFTEYDIDKDKVAAKRKKKLSGGSGVPFALINGKGVYGFSKATYARALGLQ